MPSTPQVPSYLAGALVGLCGLLVAWQFVTAAGVANEFFLPSPIQVAKAFYILIFHENYLVDVGTSIYRVMAAFVLSGIIGVPLGVLSGRPGWAGQIVAPVVDFMRYMPVAGFIPLTILWIGVNDAQKIGLLFLGTFVQLVPLVADVVKAVPEELIDTAKMLGASRQQLMGMVILRYSIPGIFDSLRIALGIAWTYLLLAEIVGASVGIGHVVTQAQRYLHTDYIFAGIFTVGFIGLLSDFLMKRLSNVLFPWAAAR